MQNIFVNNAQFSQVISGDGANQSEISSEIKRGGIASPLHHTEQHVEPRHEDVHAAVATEPAVSAEPVIDERANLLAKLSAVIENPATSLAELQKLAEDVS